MKREALWYFQVNGIILHNIFSVEKLKCADEKENIQIEALVIVVCLFVFFFSQG